MSDRREILRSVADAILRLPAAHVVRVAIDGVDGAGKTIFAGELARMLDTFGRPTIRASADSFHNPKAIRYRRGCHSPEGYFLDSYDYARLKAVLLDPLGPAGSGRYRTAIFDHWTDRPVTMPEAQAAPGDILIFDGIFLHRPELRPCWDFSIFLEVGFDISLPRFALRDNAPLDPQAPANRRYVEGQQLYLRACEPRRYATLVINNENLEAPYIVGVE